MRILVCGSRGLKHTLAVRKYLRDFVMAYLRKRAELSGSRCDEPIVIIHGACEGSPDVVGAGLGWDTKWIVVPYPANWAKYGLRAGPIRNQEMLVKSKPDIIIAFWDGRSAGTLNMVSLAKAAGVRTVVVTYEAEYHPKTVLDKYSNL